VKVSDLPYNEWASLLASSGATINTEPFTINVSSNLSLVSEGLYLLYADYEIFTEHDYFVDFYVTVKAPRSIRRWYRPKVFFSYDGSEPFKPLPQQQALPVFEWGLNWCIATSAHQYLMIHAAVVEKAGKALILPAPPGSGKSTLCAGLVSRGWRLLSDEMTLIDPINGQIVPAPRPISLKNESIPVIKTFAPDFVFGPESDETHKGRVSHIRPPESSIIRAHETADASIILFPKYVAGSATQFESRSRARTAIELAENAFNFNILGKEGFGLLTSTVANCDCYSLEYSDLDEVITRLDHLICKVPDVEQVTANA